MFFMRFSIVLCRLFPVDVVGGEVRRRGLDLELAVEMVDPSLVRLCLVGLCCRNLNGTALRSDPADSGGECGDLRGFYAHRVEVHRTRPFHARRRLGMPRRAAVLVILPMVPVHAAIGRLGARASTGEAINHAGEDAGERQRAADDD